MNTDISVPEKSAILVLEDDSEIRTMVLAILKPLDHPILTSASLKEAYKLWWTESARIALLVTDVSLSDGSGLIFARFALDTSPHLKVIVMTGHPTTIDFGGPNNQRTVLLQKPFGIAELRDYASSLLAPSPP